MLRPVHGGVGLTDQVVRAAFAGREDGNPDAGRQVEFINVDAERLPDSIKYLFAQCDRHVFGLLLGVFSLIQNDQEFISAEAGNDVLSFYTVGQSAGGLDQEPVADGMTERIINIFEMVEVDKQNPAEATVFLRLADLAL